MIQDVNNLKREKCLLTLRMTFAEREMVEINSINHL